MKGKKLNHFCFFVIFCFLFSIVVVNANVMDELKEKKNLSSIVPVSQGPLPVNQMVETDKNSNEVSDSGISLKERKEAIKSLKSSIKELKSELKSELKELKKTFKEEKNEIKENYKSSEQEGKTGLLSNLGQKISELVHNIISVIKNMISSILGIFKSDKNTNDETTTNEVAQPSNNEQEQASTTPSTQEPATTTPGTQEPGQTSSTNQEPTATTPATKEPVTTTPGTQEPEQTSSVDQEPTATTPATQETEPAQTATNPKQDITYHYDSSGNIEYTTSKPYISKTIAEDGSVKTVSYTDVIFYKDNRPVLSTNLITDQANKIADNIVAINKIISGVDNTKQLDTNYMDNVLKQIKDLLSK